MDIKERISQRNCYIGENNPKYIVIHETDNYDKGAGAKTHSIAQYNGNLGSASVHYYVDDKEIYRCLSHNDGAWSVGDGHGKYGITNTNSINIEICVNPDSNYSKAVDNAIELTKYLMNELGLEIDRVVRHYDASRKCCPSTMSANNWAKWWEFKNRLKNNSLSNTGANSKIEEANQNCYIFTEYLPTGYLGKQGTDFQGLDVLYVNEYMCGVRWENRKNDYGYYAVTELLDPTTAKKLKETLGSWFCEFRTSNK